MIDLRQTITVAQCLTEVQRKKVSDMMFSYLLEIRVMDLNYACIRTLACIIFTSKCEFVYTTDIERLIIQFEDTIANL